MRSSSLVRLAAGWGNRFICARFAGGRGGGAQATERGQGDLVRRSIRDGLVPAAHDVSDGGVLGAVAEMAIASGIGAVLETASKVPAHAFWSGEDQARYVVTAKLTEPIF